MAFEFSTATFEMIQQLVYPLLKTLVGFDAQAWTGDKSELFLHIGDLFSDIGALFTVVGTALEDGILTAAEIETIIADAKTIPDAIDQIVGFFKDEEPTPAP